MVTVIKGLDFKEKIVRPFTTHEGFGLGNIPSQLRKICTGATVKEGLAIYGMMSIMLKTKLKSGFNNKISGDIFDLL